MLPVDLDRKYVSSLRNPGSDVRHLVRKFFENAGPGFYVDVGANHPTRGSQSWHLEEQGWKGILVEPLPDYCALLSAQRTGIVVQCACSNRVNHGTTMPLVSAHAYSTLNARPIVRRTIAADHINVQVRTLDSILEEYSAPQPLDFLSIDVEGHEVELFDGFSFDRWRPKLVVLEDHVLDRRKHDYMVKSGYQLVVRMNLDSVYVPQEHGFRHSLLARAQFLRKYWLAVPFRRVAHYRSL